MKFSFSGSLFLAMVLSLIVWRCESSEEIKLKVVTYEQFEEFIEETGYVTDAERYGWSIVQQNVFDFIKVDRANWKFPDGINPPSSKKLPVTQVSYNDAIAYCEWSGEYLPSYEEYWELVKADKRDTVTDNKNQISEPENVNIVGNVWEITSTFQQDGVRLAGGSLFCSVNTCHGTAPERELYVNKETGNIHIGFAVLNKTTRSKLFNNFKK
jgi:formylglycine-generating enzyme required for sulfatase activity